MGRVKAVRGNMDSPEIKAALPEKDVFEAGGKRIGLIHGWGVPWGLGERVREQFDGVDVIVFGHPHPPCNRHVRGVLPVNPGGR